MAAKYRVEGEGSTRLGEEPLRVGVAGQSPAEDLGLEVAARELAGNALVGEEAGPDALGAVLEEHGEDVVAAHQVHGPSAEVPHLVGQGERGELGDGARHLDTVPLAFEDAPLEAGREPGADAVGMHRRHRQPARWT